MNRGRSGQAAAAVAQGARILKDLPLINGFVMELPVRAVEALARAPGVHYVSPDAPMFSAGEPAIVETVRDEFSSASYDNNDGTTNWASGWVEDDPKWGRAGPAAGQVQIVSSELRLDDRPDTGRHPSIARAADLSNGATTATFSFDFRTSPGVDTHEDRIAIEVSADGGASYTILDIIDVGGGSSGSRSYNISGLISASTMVRFRVAERYGGFDEYFYVDNVQIECGCPECIDTSNLASAYIRAIGADRVWNEPPDLQGQGIAVAVVDSGIANVGDFKGTDGSPRVQTSVCLLSSGGEPHEDLNGHGTHVAGIVGGNGLSSQGAYPGVAPKVDLVDIRVGDAQGMSLTSDVVDGLQWIHDHRALYNIRVVNLSLNSSVPESYYTNPLDAAVEILWFSGIVVVVSAGNNQASERGGILYPPANDPFVITVGAADDVGTPDLVDDILGSFSAYGTTEDGFAKPDIVAPGVDIISAMAGTASTVFVERPAHRVEAPPGVLDRYFRMSGTSMAAAAASGAAALLLQDEPGLTPNQVKYRLMTTAASFNGPEPGSAGAGYLDAYGAVHGTTMESANAGIMPHELLAKMVLIAVWASENGGDWVDWGSVNWDSVNWDSVNWDSVNWDSVNWDSVNWDSVNWDSVNWDSVLWDD